MSWLRARAESWRARSYWRAWVEVEATRLEEELSFLDDVPAPVAEAVTEAITVARAAAQRGGGFRGWWTGSDIETAWRSIHRGQQQLLLVAPAARVRALAPEIGAAVQASLRPGDPRRRDYLKAMRGLAADARVTELERETARTVLRAAHSASDISYSNLRAFRNLVLTVTLLLASVLAGISVLQQQHPGTLSLCTERADAAPTTTTTTMAVGSAGEATPQANDTRRLSCPTGTNRESSIWDVVAVQMVGALGALLAAAVTLSRQRRFQAPYGLPLAQVLLKVVAGTATALFGVVLLQNGVLGVTPAASGQAILAYAALFGYAQQAATKQVDEKAKSLLGVATTKGDAARESGDGGSADESAADGDKGGDRD